MSFPGHAIRLSGYKCSQSPKRKEWGIGDVHPKSRDLLSGPGPTSVAWAPLVQSGHKDQAGFSHALPDIPTPAVPQCLESNLKCRRERGQDNGFPSAPIDPPDWEGAPGLPPPGPGRSHRLAPEIIVPAAGRALWEGAGGRSRVRSRPAQPEFIKLATRSLAAAGGVVGRDASLLTAGSCSAPRCGLRAPAPCTFPANPPGLALPAPGAGGRGA